MLIFEKRSPMVKFSVPRFALEANVLRAGYVSLQLKAQVKLWASKHIHPKLLARLAEWLATLRPTQRAVTGVISPSRATGKPRAGQFLVSRDNFPEFFGPFYGGAMHAGLANALSCVDRVLLQAGTPSTSTWRRMKLCRP